MKNKILLLFTLLITFFLNAQEDSQVINNLESKFPITNVSIVDETINITKIKQNTCYII